MLSAEVTPSEVPPVRMPILPVEPRSSWPEPEKTHGFRNLVIAGGLALAGGLMLFLLIPKRA